MRVLCALRGGAPETPVSVVDAAYWRKGCSSLGRLRYAVMLFIGEDKSSPLCLIDVKEAAPAAAPNAPGAGIGKSVAMRELMPQDLKIEVGALSQKRAMALSRYLARVVGRAHGRQMEDATREEWRRNLAGFRSGGLEAPRWLCSNELLGIHEIAYLEHCRIFALGPKPEQTALEAMRTKADGTASSAAGLNTYITAVKAFLGFAHSRLHALQRRPADPAQEGST